MTNTIATSLIDAAVIGGARVRTEDELPAPPAGRGPGGRCACVQPSEPRPQELEEGLLIEIKWDS